MKDSILSLDPYRPMNDVITIPQKFNTFDAVTFGHRTQHGADG
jgi:hypothetical protein